MGKYTNINKHEKSISITFNIQDDRIMDIGEKMNEMNEEAYMNGYNWSAFLHYYLEKNYPHILEGLGEDPEAGMYCGYYESSSENEQKAIEFEKVINSLIESEEQIYVILAENGEEIDWD